MSKSYATFLGSRSNRPWGVVLFKTDVFLTPFYFLPLSLSLLRTERRIHMSRMARRTPIVHVAGINPASAAWWTMASHLAAQDYIARLQGAAGLPGFPPGAESLLPPYPASLLNPPSLSSHKSSKCK